MQDIGHQIVVKRSHRDSLAKFREGFASKPLSSGIATLPSLIVLDSILKTYQISNVLEIGRGLGTLTKFIGEELDCVIHSVESNQYCINQSAFNCAGVEYLPYLGVSHIATESLHDIDLVVIDGPISRHEFPLLFLGDKVRIYFFENHQLVTKVRVLFHLFLQRRQARYVEVFPDHNFEGPSYVVSLPIMSKTSFLIGNTLSFVIMSPRLLRHCVHKLKKFQNPLVDSYSISMWNPLDRL